MHFREDWGGPFDPQYWPHDLDLGTVGEIEDDALHPARPEGHYYKLAGARLHAIGERVAECPVVPHWSVHGNFSESVLVRQARTSTAGAMDGTACWLPSLPGRLAWTPECVARRPGAGRGG